MKISVLFTRSAFAAAVLLVTACASGGSSIGEPTVQPPSAQQPPYASVSLDRSAPPAVTGVPGLRLPAIQEFTLGNGMRVLLMEKRDVPLVQVNLVVDAGSVNDPAGKAGLASLTADMLDEGAGGRDALELSSAFELLGARFGVGASTHGSSVSLFVPTARLADALPLVADVVLRPTFPAAELDRLRSERISSLLRARDVPGAIASSLVTQTLFEAVHPYGRIITADALRAIALDDIRGFHHRHWTPDNTTAVVVGDVTADGARALLESAFGAWQPAANPPANVLDAPQVQGRTIYIVDKPGAAQSAMMLARIGVRRATEDYFPLEVMNTILGGSFTSRLNQNLRETHGYAYGASSSFDYRLAAGPFIASSNVQTQSTGPALAEFIKELRRIREDVTAEEIERAKNNLAYRYPAGFQSVSGIAGRLGDIVSYDLPADYFNQYIAKVLAVTPADVQRVARTYIDPDNIAVVIVGDRARIEQQVRDQNLGDIRFLTVADVLGPVPASN